MTLPAKIFLSIGDCIAALRDESNRVIFVDGSYYTAKNRNGQSESRPRIAGARFFDIERTFDRASFQSQIDRRERIKRAPLAFFPLRIHPLPNPLPLIQVTTIHRNHVPLQTI